LWKSGDLAGLDAMLLSFYVVALFLLTGLFVTIQAFLTVVVDMRMSAPAGIGFALIVALYTLHSKKCRP